MVPYAYKSNTSVGETEDCQELQISLGCMVGPCLKISGATELRTVGRLGMSSCWIHDVHYNSLVKLELMHHCGLMQITWLLWTLANWLTEMSPLRDANILAHILNYKIKGLWLSLLFVFWLGSLSALNISGKDKERIKTTIQRGDHQKRRQGGRMVEYEWDLMIWTCKETHYL